MYKTLTNYTIPTRVFIIATISTWFFGYASAQAQLQPTPSPLPQQLSPQMQNLFNQPAVSVAPYFGIGVDDLDSAQYEALGTGLDWGQGKCPGGGVIISFVEPGGEAFQRGVRWGDILLGVDLGGGAKNVILAQDLFAKAGAMQQGQKAVFHFFQAGRVVNMPLIAQPWPQKALEIWPKDSPKGAFFFPFLKEQEKLLNYRVKDYQDRHLRDPDPLILKGIADIYLLTNHFALAIENYDSFLDETSKNPQIPHYPALYAKAYAARCLGEYEKSRKAAEDAVSERPNSIMALFEWSQALNGLGQPEAALKCVDNAINLTPANNTALKTYFEGWRAKINVVPPAIATRSAFAGPHAYTATPSVQATPQPTLTPTSSSPPGILLGLYPSPEPRPAMTPVAHRLDPALYPSPSSQSAMTPPSHIFAASQPSRITSSGLKLDIQTVKTLLPASPGEHIVVVVDYQVSGISAQEKVDVQERVYLNSGTTHAKIWEWTTHAVQGLPD